MSLVTGCTASTKRAGYVGGGVLAAGGGILTMSAAMTDCSSLHMDEVWFNGTGCDVESGLVGSMGLITMLGGVAILLAAAAAPNEETPPPARVALSPTTVDFTSTLPPVEPPTDDPTLRNFTQQASMAARTGQCLAVQAIAKRVEDLDIAYRYDGFLGDPLVVACLQ